MIAFIPLLATCAPRRQNNPMNALFGDKPDVGKNTILSIYRMGKPAIPLLIDMIENPRPIEIILESPSRSTIELKQPQGILAAYLIEWILAIDSVNLDDIMKSPFLFGDEQNYIYPQACIVIGGRRASAEDLIAVKSLYQEWWRRSSSKELSELRLQWKHGVRPLGGTAYSWQ
jgi:hypothetical protein